MRLERRFRRNWVRWSRGQAVASSFFVIVLNRDPPNDMKLDDLAMAKSTSDDLNDTNNKATLETVIPFGN